MRGHSITPGRTEGPLGGGPPDTARSIGAHHTLAADQVATPIAETASRVRREGSAGIVSASQPPGSVVKCGAGRASHQDGIATVRTVTFVRLRSGERSVGN